MKYARLPTLILCEQVDDDLPCSGGQANEIDEEIPPTLRSPISGFFRIQERAVLVSFDESVEGPATQRTPFVA